MIEIKHLYKCLFEEYNKSFLRKMCIFTNNKMCFPMLDYGIYVIYQQQYFESLYCRYF